MHLRIMTLIILARMMVILLEDIVQSQDRRDL